MTKQLMIDTWSLAPYRVLTESESASYRNESSFQSIYTNIEQSGVSPKVLCIIEGRFGKNNAISVNGRYYGDNFWNIQLAKEQTQFLLRKGLMWQMFGHVDRGIEDKDAEKGLVAGIVTHLEVVKAPTTINGVDYNAGDLFGRAIIIDMEAGRNTHTLLSVGSEISISSRGLGEYIVGETFQCEDGTRIPIMNPETYELETFDYTRLPGISDAMVHTVKDSIKTNESENVEEDDFDFDNESFEVSDTTLALLNESISSLIFNMNQKENDMAKVKGVDVQRVLEEANAKIASLTAKLEDAESEKAAAEEKVAELQKELDEKQETIEAGTEPEETVENPEAVKAEVEKEAEAEELVEEVVDTTELDEFKAIAENPDELKEVLVKVDETLRKCEDDAAEIERLRAERDNLKADLDEKEKEVQEACKALESYVALGSISELKAIVESNQKLRNEAREQKLAQFAQHYSVKKGITLESVKRIIDSSKSFKAAQAVLESLPNKEVNKGLFRTETAKKESVETVKATFAESFINKAENRRTKTYTV